MLNGRLFLPTPAWTRALFAPVLIFVAAGIDRNYQTDFWHHLARGDAMAERGEIVNHDLFTCTVPGKEFQDTNWLSQLLYHCLFGAGGLPLVQLVNALVLAAMMAVLVGLCWQRSRSLTLAAGLGAFSFLGLWQLLLIRPQTFSFLLFVLLLAVLEGAAKRRWLLAAAPCLLALWTNLHGGFPVGLLVIACYLAAAGAEAWWSGTRPWRDRHTRTLALTLAVSVLATFLNPYGVRVYQYVSLTSTVASVRRIDEWLPPGLNLFVGKVWVLSVVGLVVLLALPGRRPRASELALMLCFLPLACGSVRMVAWWLFIAAPIAAAQLEAIIPPRHLVESDQHQPSLGTGLLFALFVIAAVLSLPWLERYNPAVSLLNPRYRTEADLEVVAQELRARKPGGRVFSRFEWGEYLGWALAPEGAVFMDGRIEIYPDRVWHDYAAVTRGRADWQEILDGYGVDCLVLDSGRGYHADLLPLVERSGAWERTVTSGRAVLFLRRGPGQATAGADPSRVLPLRQ
jgi:hypothetical protein